MKRRSEIPQQDVCETCLIGRITNPAKRLAAIQAVHMAMRKYYDLDMPLETARRRALIQPKPLLIARGAEAVVAFNSCLDVQADPRASYCLTPPPRKLQQEPTAPPEVVHFGSREAESANS